MDTGTEPDGAERFFNLTTVAGGLVAAASIGISTLTPLIWPERGQKLGVVLVVLCGLAMLVGLFLLWLGHRQRTTGTSRRWKIVGMGQGWIEARVRNDGGDQIVATWNSGGDADEIYIWPTFRRRSEPRRSDIIEMIFEVDGTAFEWDVPDTGEASFTLHGATWRVVEAIKAMFVVMREGKSLVVSVPALSLRARFTLDGAFDTLEEAATLGEEAAGVDAGAPPG